MSPLKIIGALLVAVGALGLGYGSFSYTKETHDLKLGPIQLSVQEKETVNIPVWAGGAAVALGVVLLLWGGRKP